MENEFNPSLELGLNCDTTRIDGRNQIQHKGQSAYFNRVMNGSKIQILCKKMKILGRILG